MACAVLPVDLRKMRVSAHFHYDVPRTQPCASGNCMECIGLYTGKCATDAKCRHGLTCGDFCHANDANSARRPSATARATATP